MNQTSVIGFLLPHGIGININCSHESLKGDLHMSEVFSCVETPDEKEILKTVLRVARTSVLQFEYRACTSPADVSVRFDGVPLADHFTIPNPDTGENRLMVFLPQLSQGLHTLVWNAIGVGKKWKTMAAVKVDATAMFRHYKKSDGSDPFLRGFLIVEAL